MKPIVPSIIKNHIPHVSEVFFHAACLNRKDVETLMERLSENPAIEVVATFH